MAEGGQVLYSCQGVRLFVIPPRDNARGHVSGNWKVDDCIFTGKLDVTEEPVSSGSHGVQYEAKIRLYSDEDGVLFAMCAVPFGKSHVVVEPVCDSSRNFVLRVEDPETKRHAFLGLSFEERSQALEFNMSLQDVQKTEERRRMAEVQKNSHNIHGNKAKDLSLKQGETIHLALSSGKGAGDRIGFLSRLDKSKDTKASGEANVDSNVVSVDKKGWTTF